MRINTTKKSGATNLALTGLMGALVIVGTFISIPIPVLGDRTMIGLGNVFCILSGLLLGPVYGGLSAGIGSGVFDLVGGWATSAPTTLINKFMMAFVCGVIAWSGKSEGKKLPRIITGAVCGSLTYCVLYLLKSFIETRLEGNSAEAAAILLGTKAVATIVNAVIADVIAVPLSIGIRRSLESNRMYLGLVETSTQQLAGHDLRRMTASILLLGQAVLQIVCVAALLPSAQADAAEAGTTLAGWAFWCAAAFSVVQIVFAVLLARKGAKMLPEAMFCCIVSPAALPAVHRVCCCAAATDTISPHRDHLPCGSHCFRRVPFPFRETGEHKGIKVEYQTFMQDSRGLIRGCLFCHKTFTNAQKPHGACISALPPGNNDCRKERKLV